MKREAENSVSFGPFRLFPTARMLEKNGSAVSLGDRALDILIVLVDRAGEIVSHKELIARVWRGLVVEPGNLRVHMRTLRVALGDGEAGVRYIENVTGQGYSFVAPVRRGESHERAAVSAVTQVTSTTARTIRPRGLPPVLTRMIGRDDTVRTVAADLRNDRFVTLVGPGGMGKTTVALSVAHAMLESFEGNVCFVDLSTMTDAALLAETVASSLGLAIQSADALVSLMGFLQQTRMLLILDNCEHVIDAAATLAETIFNQAPDVCILATSREALRVQGEHAYRLLPLDTPAPDTEVTAEQALTFPAVKLFVERAIAADRHFELTDTNARLIADICGRLDGIALALELVASRVGTYGIEGTTELLSKRLGLHWQGRRTAVPRHQTLQALLDWSYGLLPATEQRVLRTLSVFVGPFTLEAATAVTADCGLNELQLTGALDQLISKSLMSVLTARDDEPRYRLLETTRVYASRKLDESGEANTAAERHARYFAQDGSSTRHERLGNLRAALEWCFSRPCALGVDLAAAAAPVFLELSLWNECRKWSEAALAQLDTSSRGDKRELVLQEALAIASLLINAEDAHTAIARGLELAERLGETAIRFRLLSARHVYLLRMTDFRAALDVAEKMDEVARSTHDVTYNIISDWMLGSSHFVLGNPATSMRLFESGFERGGAREAGKGQQLAGLYYRTRALYGLARVQWLCGFPDRALETARQAVIEAAETGSPVNVSYSLVYCCYVFLWCGDLDTAQGMIDKVMAQPHWQGRLVWFHAEALALKGELLVRRGELEAGLELLRRVLSEMQSRRQKNLMQTVTACGLAEGLIAAGRSEEALAVIDEAIETSPGGTDTWDGPELLRVRASVLLSLPTPDLARAETTILHALGRAKRQNAIGWELRAALTLVQLRSLQDRAAEGRAALANLYDRFTEGFATADLETAREILKLTHPNPTRSHPP